MILSRDEDAFLSRGAIYAAGLREIVESRPQLYAEYRAHLGAYFDEASDFRLLNTFVSAPIATQFFLDAEDFLAFVVRSVYATANTPSHRFLKTVIAAFEEDPMVSLSAEFAELRAAQEFAEVVSGYDIVMPVAEVRSVLFELEDEGRRASVLAAVSRDILESAATRAFSGVGSVAPLFTKKRVFIRVAEDLDVLHELFEGTRNPGAVLRKILPFLLKRGQADAVREVLAARSERGDSAA